jgi:iron complex outermembrane receptor protein
VRWAIASGAALVVATPVCADDAARPIALPGGRVADVVLALGRQAGISVLVDDPGLWNRRIGPIRAPSPRSAVDAIARAAGGKSRKVAAGWRIVPRAPIRRPSAIPRLVPARTSVEPAADVVVIASKRDARVADVAGSVAILRGDDLALGGTRGTEAIVSRLTGMSSTYLGAGRNKLFVRGLGDSSFTGPTQATVGQYLGDLRLSYNAADPDLRLADIASVEVLEGPQGTLYGAGSLGGIVRLTANAPEPGRTAGSISAGVATTRAGAASADLTGTFNLPLGGAAAVRATGYAIEDGGFIDEPVLARRDINRVRTTGGRIAARTGVGADWTIDAGGVLQAIRGADSQYADLGGRLVRASPVRQPFAADYALGQLVVSGKLGDVSLRSTTGVVRQSLEERFDATLPNEAARIFVQRNATDMIANETRVWSPLRRTLGWVIGASVVANRSRLSRALGDVAAPLPVGGVDNRITETTLFGEGSVRLRRGMILTAGGRLTRSALSGAGIDVDLSTQSAAALAGRTEMQVAPSVSLLGEVANGVSLFARYQGGFRPGGLAIGDGFVQRFRGDRTRMVEAGARLRLPDRAMSASVSLSRTGWSDIQADYIDAAGLPSTANIGDGRIWTLSAAATWVPLVGLEFDAGLTLNASRVVVPASITDIRLVALGEIPNIAGATGRLGFDYRRTVGRSTELRINGYARYVGSSRLGVGPALGERQGDYLDTALVLRVGSGALGATLGVTNLLDTLGNRFALGTPFPVERSQMTPQRPRTVRFGIDAGF